MDGKHVVFGKVADDAGKEIVKKLEKTGTGTGAIQFQKKPTIIDCGESK